MPGRSSVVAAAQPQRQLSNSGSGGVAGVIAELVSPEARVSVSDGTNPAQTVSFDWTVNDVNRAPVAADDAAGPRRAREGDAVLGVEVVEPVAVVRDRVAAEREA